MPYIKPRLRRKFDESIEELLSEIKQDALLEGDNHSIDGWVNYAITKLLVGIYSPDSYFNFNRAMGTLESEKLEFYRRKVAFYEDQKCLQNGDVY